jgi:hypothetical protein
MTYEDLKNFYLNKKTCIVCSKKLLKVKNLNEVVYCDNYLDENCHYYHLYMNDDLFQIHSDNYVIRVVDSILTVIGKSDDTPHNSKFSFNVSLDSLFFNTLDEMKMFASRVEGNLMLL